MGLFDSLLGRTKPPAADLSVLFSVPQAAISLQVEGFEFTGTGSVCFRDTEGAADDVVLAEVTQVVTTDDLARVETTTDSYGFSWFTVTRPGGDAVGIATDLHAVNSSLADHGFDTHLLCSTFVFSDGQRNVALVYLFKRGTFYPFAPESGSDPGSRRRDNALELRIRGLVGDDVPIESDLGRWLAIWGAPGL